MRHFSNCIFHKQTYTFRNIIHNLGKHITKSPLQKLMKRITPSSIHSTDIMGSIEISGHTGKNLLKQPRIELLR